MKLGARSLPNWWALVFAASAAVGAFMLATADGVPSARLVLGWVLVAFVGLSWLVVGRSIAARPFLVWVFLVVFAAMLAVVVSANPTTAILQSVGYPYVWVFLERIDAVLAGNLIIAGATLGGFLWYGLGPSDALISTGISLAFSLGMGFWIQSLIRAATERAALEARVEAVSGELAKSQREMGAIAERERFSQELHDTLTQHLTALVMLTEKTQDELAAGGQDAAATLAVAERTARDALAEARSLVAHGSGREVDTGGLAESVRRTAENFAEETGVRVELNLSSDLGRVQRAEQVALLRGVQETLANVRKHAHAHSVQISLTTPDAAHVSLVVQDDGVGFSVSVANALDRGFGLSGLTSRFALVGGSVAITSDAHGTCVSMELPTAPGEETP